MDRKTFEKFLSDVLDKGHCDFSLMAKKSQQGEVTFYIHPNNIDGETVDFVVQGNTLIPIQNYV